MIAWKNCVSARCRLLYIRQLFVGLREISVMPSLDWNVRIWDGEYEWDRGGDEWSSAWGSPEAQWLWSLRPRMQALLPAATVLEIGPGYGRWSQFLLEESRNLVLVDISKSCIDACRERFGSSSGITFLVNDGTSLAGVDDASIDLVFSFDSLVHAELDVLRGYLDELASKLAPDGAIFIHHSNLGEFRYFRILRKIESLLKPPGSVFAAAGSPGERQGAGIGRKLMKAFAAMLMWLKIVDRSHMRASNVSAREFRHVADESGFSCISQEVMRWGRSRRAIDCISVLVRKGSRLDRPYRGLVNRKFMREAAQARRIAGLYAVDEK